MHKERNRSSLSASILCAAADESLPKCARTPKGRRAASIAATASFASASSAGSALNDLCANQPVRRMREVMIQQWRRRASTII